MAKWQKLANDETISKVVSALKENGIDSYVVKNSEEAKNKVLELVPQGSEVMTMTSLTLDTTKIADEINQSGKFDSVRNKLFKMDRKTQSQEMNKLGAAPKFVIGSVHALTEEGNLLIASASGSQLPAYVYSSEKVIFVVGTQKIVKNTDEGIKRIYEHVFPLEDERARKAYGVGSGVNKLLIINKEFNPGRITVVLVEEKLGF